jgi:hypothetical protein
MEGVHDEYTNPPRRTSFAVKTGLNAKQQLRNSLRVSIRGN